jgi:hypothetical protein
MGDDAEVADLIHRGLFSRDLVVEARVFVKETQGQTSAILRKS